MQSRKALGYCQLLKLNVDPDIPENGLSQILGWSSKRNKTASLTSLGSKWKIGHQNGQSKDKNE